MFNQKLLLYCFTVLTIALPLTVSHAAEDATLNGLNIQKNGSKTQIKLDVEKSTQAKVKKNADGSVVIQLPKTKLPKAYQEFGMPSIKQNGVSASVQSKGDTVEITVPNAGNLEVKLSNGKTVKSTASSSPTQKAKTVSTKTTSTPIAKAKVTVAKTASTTTKPKVVTKTVKAPAKVVTQSKSAAKKPTVATTTSIKAKASVTTAKTPVEKPKTASQKPADDLLDLEALTKPSTSQKVGAAAGAVTSTTDKTSTPEAQQPVTASDGSEILNLDESNAPDLTKTAETTESKLPGQEQPMAAQSASDIDSLLQTWVYGPLTEFQNATSSVLGANWMNDWGFLALAAVGGLLIAFVILSTLVRLLFGKKQPKAQKVKPAKKGKKSKMAPQSQLQDEEELYMPNQDEFVPYQQPAEYGQPDLMRDPEVTQTPRFENFLQDELPHQQEALQQTTPNAETLPVMPQQQQQAITQTPNTAATSRRHNARVNNPGGVPEHLKRSSENLEGTNARFLNMIKKQQNS